MIGIVLAALVFASVPVTSAFAAESGVLCSVIMGKGRGSCKTASNSCKGQNSCKGKGLCSLPPMIVLKQMAIMAVHNQDLNATDKMNGYVKNTVK